VIDFHCHIDLYPNPAAVLEEVVRRHCYVLAVTTSPLAWTGTKRLVGSVRRVRIGLGLHPELVATRAKEIDRFCELVAETDFIGEVGIDGSRPHQSSLPVQQEIFRTILATAAAHGGRVISVHSRGAAATVLQELGRCDRANKPVLHWFSGTQRELESAIEMGCWFSVGPAMLKTSKGFALAARMPANRVLTESDGPFTRKNGASMYPWDVTDAEVVLGKAWGVSADEARTRIHENLRSLLNSE
jgi:TatD DNase family protein